MNIVEFINAYTRRVTPNFKQIVSELEIGDYKLIGRDKLVSNKDKRSIPTSMRGKISPIKNLPDSMNYLIIRCTDIFIGHEYVDYKFISHHIPIEKIHTYEDGSVAYVILIQSHDKVVNYNMIPDLKITTILSNIDTPRYKIVKDRDYCSINIYTKDTMCDSNRLTDKYHYLLSKSLVNGITQEFISETSYVIKGDVSIGILNPNTWKYDDVQTVSIKVNIESEEDTDDDKLDLTFKQKVIVHRALSHINRDKLDEMMQKYYQ